MSSRSGDPIPDEVKRLIREHIDSVPALEALLLMKRTPERKWTVSMMAAELYMDPRRVAGLLADLASRGLCGTEPQSEAVYFWHPASREMAEGLARLADVHAHYLVAVTNLIHAKPRAAVRGFSDAFRLRGTE